jgi:arylsulfatase
MALKGYGPGSRFPGVIGRTADVSSPAWPEPVRAKDGAPNVLFIVLDDTGYGHLVCYGSPIRTPTSMRWQQTGCSTATGSVANVRSNRRPRFEIVG